MNDKKEDTYLPLYEISEGTRLCEGFRLLMDDEPHATSNIPQAEYEGDKYGNLGELLR